LGVNGYVIASARIKVDHANTDGAVADAAMEARKCDRERAMILARYLDEKFPNDTATDAARHRLASMLVEEKRPSEAFEVILKVRPGYPQLPGVRLLEGYIATQLIASKDIPLPAGGKAAVFRRAVADLDRVARPPTIAKEEEVRDYLSVRSRLASLYLLQSRAELKDTPGQGFDKALAIADEMLGLVPTFECLKDKEGGKLTPAGMEMHFLGLDARTRAVFLRSKNKVDTKDIDEAAKAIEPLLEEISKSGPTFDETMKQWAGDENPQKVKVASLAQGIDRIRREIVMLGFKLRVRQGKPGEATEMLKLLETAGSSIEENQPTLETMARELAVQISSLKKGGQGGEAKAMGEGLAILLKRLSSIPNLSSASILFLGETLYLVEQYDEALKEFAKIPTPVIPKVQGVEPVAPQPKTGNKEQTWWDFDPNKLPPGNQDKEKFIALVRNYRPAQLFTARCLRGLNKFADAEKLLTAAIGTGDKSGFAYLIPDFRRELAFLYEAKGASLNGKPSQDEWGKALKEWTTLFNFSKNELSKLKDPTPEREKQVKSRFFDAYFEIQRCLILANSHLQKGTSKLADTFTKSGKQIAAMEADHKLAELEKKGTGIISPEVWNHYCDLLDKYPELKNAYKAAGGKFFLERPKE
jgi:tetratricopeptide (TPR) repeat protein